MESAYRTDSMCAQTQNVVENSYASSEAKCEDGAALIATPIWNQNRGIISVPFISDFVTLFGAQARRCVLARMLSAGDLLRINVIGSVGVLT